jgi:drug/metabolite transporter (DMT)-like permease
MSPILIATLAGLVAAVCWGTADWLSARSTKQNGTIEINFGVQVASGSLAVILGIISGFHLPETDLLITIVWGSILMTAGYLLFVKALSSGVVGIIVPIGNSYPLITVLLAIVLLGRAFSLKEISAFLLIIIGASILAYEKNHRKVPLKELHRESMLAALAALVWGLAYYVLDPVVAKVSWQQLTVISEVVITIIAALLLVIKYKSEVAAAARRSLSTPWPLLVGITGTTGFAAVYLGSNRAGSVVIPVILTSCSSLIASAWGAVMDKEKIGAIKRVGAVVIVAGIIVLNVS